MNTVEWSIVFFLMAIILTALGVIFYRLDFASNMLYVYIAEGLSFIMYIATIDMLVKLFLFNKSKE
jgi:hypothetical protein